jgi:hypothetical protein
MRTSAGTWPIFAGDEGAQNPSPVFTKRGYKIRMATSINVDTVDSPDEGRTRLTKMIERLVIAKDLPILLGGDAVHGSDDTAVSIEHLAAPDGFLPPLLVSVDATWSEMTGRSIGLSLVRDGNALFGYRVEHVPTLPVSILSLCVLETLAAATTPDCILLNNLVVKWDQADKTPYVTGASSVWPDPLARP